MSDKLKQWVDRHRQQLDDAEPGAGLWDKIDARLEVKQASQISSRWLSGLKYLGFSASVLVAAVWMICRSLNPSPANRQAVAGKDQRWQQPVQPVAAHQVKAGSNAPHGTASGLAPAFSSPPAKQENAGLRSGAAVATASFETAGAEQAEASGSYNEAGAPETAAANEKREARPVAKRKKAELYIPEEPEKMNSYTATLYDESFLCSVVQAFRFPGKASVDAGSWKRHEKRLFVQTVSCAYLEKTTHACAVWLKGRTDKELVIAMKKDLKNIVLLKPDGSKAHPEAISHYYSGRGVITNYRGRYFNMTFSDKVGLVLFFKHAEEGDKLLINGSIEAIIKNKP